MNLWMTLRTAVDVSERVCAADCDSLRPHATTGGQERQRTMYGHVRQCTAKYGIVRQCTAMYGNVRLCAAMYGNVRQCTAMYGNVKHSAPKRLNHKNKGQAAVLRAGPLLPTACLWANDCKGSAHRPHAASSHAASDCNPCHTRHH